MEEENGGEIFRATCMTDFNWKCCSFTFRNSGFMFAKSFYDLDYLSLFRKIIIAIERFEDKIKDFQFEENENKVEI